MILLYDLDVEVEIDLSKFNLKHLIEYIEGEGYVVIPDNERDDLIDATDTDALIEELECHGYWVRKGNSKLKALEEYIINNKLNDIQIDELIEKILP